MVFEKLRTILAGIKRKFIRTSVDALKKEVADNLNRGYIKFKGTKDEWAKMSKKTAQRYGVANALKAGMSQEDQEEQSGQHLVNTLRSQISEHEGIVSVGSPELPYAQMLEKGKNVMVQETPEHGRKVRTIPARPFFAPALKTVMEQAERELVREIKASLVGLEVKIKL